jgi:ATP-dependent RNA circularization protein (DNA/RNA ligase family)
VADDFTKFPRTPHLLWLNAGPLRNDKLMDAVEAERLLRQPLAVEEKIDGANLGLSLGPDGRVRAQSRGNYITTGTGGQWQPLWRWLARRDQGLRTGLAGLIAFGEWCFARHTVHYDALPDWFVLFDIYERGAGRFWSRERRDLWAREHDIHVAPLLGSGRYTRKGLERFLSMSSSFGSERVEGVYLRWDEGDWLVARAKIVRAGWVMADDEHWSARPLQTNQIAGAVEAAHRE